jgi:hypothetical protein
MHVSWNVCYDGQVPVQAFCSLVHHSQGMFVDVRTAVSKHARPPETDGCRSNRMLTTCSSTRTV